MTVNNCYSATVQVQAFNGFLPFFSHYKQMQQCEGKCLDF